MNDTPTHRVLLVSYHYGPDCATGGFRWTEMVPDLVRLGWRFDIVTIARPGFLPTGTDPRAAVAADVETWTVEVPAGYRLAAQLTGNAIDRATTLLQRLRGGRPPAPAAAPTLDPSRVVVARRGHKRSLRQAVAATLSGISEATLDWGWTRAARRLGFRLCRHRSYAAIVVSSPPHLTQWAGAALSRASSVPFIPDLRDPWLMGIGASRTNANPVHRRLAGWFEPRVYRRAALVVHNTGRARDAVAADAPEIQVPRTAIANGYDDLGPVHDPSPDQFVVAYTGTLHPWMDIRPVFQACQHLRASEPAAGRALRIRFMGVSTDFGGVSLVRLADSYGLGDCFELLPRGSREQAALLQQTAAVLVAFDCTHPLCIPTKFYDYARLKGSMLLLGHPEGAMADAASEIGLTVHRPDDGPGIDAALAAAFSRWARGGPWSTQDPDGRFRRSAQAERWHEVLASLNR